LINSRGVEQKKLLENKSNFVQARSHQGRTHFGNAMKFIRKQELTTCCRKEISPIQVIWDFPYANWVKVNIDSAARGCSGFSTCAGIFRSSSSEYIVVSPLFLEYKNLYMLRLWESFWLLTFLIAKALDVFVWLFPALSSILFV